MYRVSAFGRSGVISVSFLTLFTPLLSDPLLRILRRYRLVWVIPHSDGARPGPCFGVEILSECLADDLGLWPALAARSLLEQKLQIFGQEDCGTFHTYSIRHTRWGDAAEMPKTLNIHQLPSPSPW